MSRKTPGEARMIELCLNAVNSVDDTQFTDMEPEEWAVIQREVSKDKPGVERFMNATLKALKMDIVEKIQEAVETDEEEPTAGGQSMGGTTNSDTAAGTAADAKSNTTPAAADSVSAGPRSRPFFKKNKFRGKKTRKRTGHFRRDKVIDKNWKDL